MTPLTLYLRKKELFTQSPGIYRNGQMYVIYQGNEITESDFRKLVNVPEKPFGEKENPNKKQIA